MVIFFDSFEVEYIAKRIETLIGNKIIKANIHKIQAYNSILCGYFGIRVNKFMLNNQRISDFTDSFSSKN